MPRRVATPPGYRWESEFVSPTGPKVVSVVVGAGLVALALVAACHGWPKEWAATIVVAGLFPIVTEFRSRNPALEVVDGRVILRFWPWRNPMTYAMILLALLAVGFVATGIREGPHYWWFILGGPAFGVLAVRTLYAECRFAGRNRMIFSPSTLRVIAAVDWEFPWSAITELTPRPVDDSRGGFRITMTCPRDAMIDRSPPQRPHTPDASEQHWTLFLAAWRVDPNSLLATLRFMVEHPQHRATITPNQLRSMLTPPSWWETAD